MNFGPKWDLNDDFRSDRLCLGPGINRRGSLIAIRAITIWERDFVLIYNELDVLVAKRVNLRVL